MDRLTYILGTVARYQPPKFDVEDFGLGSPNTPKGVAGTKFW